MEYPVALLVFAPVLGEIVYCLVHVSACRLQTSASRYFPLVVGCLVGLIATLAASLGALLWSGTGLLDALSLMALNFVTYMALAFGYFNFVNVNIASLRIRMMLELLERDGLSREQLLSGYNTQHIIGLRISRLTSGGHLREDQGRFYRGRNLRFLMLAQTYDFLRWMIFGRNQPAIPATAAACRTTSTDSSHER